MASAFRFLTALNPKPEMHENLYDFTPDNLLEYLAKEKAIPLSLLYQIRETRRKEAQHKQDLQETIVSGEGRGEYTPDPKFSKEGADLPPEEEEPAPAYPE